MTQKESQHRWYEKNKERHKANVAPRRTENARVNAEYIRHLKSSTPCADCGKVYPAYVMDFDHLRDKTKIVSRLVGYSMNRLKHEISKCEIVCSNCHRERTYQRARNSMVECGTLNPEVESSNLFVLTNPK